MTAFSIIIAVIWLVSGALLLWVGIKAGKGTLPRNEWVGIRTPELKASDHAWMTGHKAAAPLLTATAVSPLIGGILCFFADDSAASWISLAVAVAMLVLVFAASAKAKKAVRH